MGSGDVIVGGIFSNIYEDCSAERWIKPNDVALPISFCIVVTGFVKL